MFQPSMCCRHAMTSFEGACLLLCFSRVCVVGLLRRRLKARVHSYVSGEYVAALKQNPADPLLSLCIGITFVHMACQKFASRRHALVVQVNCQQLVTLRAKHRDTLLHLEIHRSTPKSMWQQIINFMVGYRMRGIMT